jgi:glucose-6-phosphate-specific signal transduction histidine kinase
VQLVALCYVLIVSAGVLELVLRGLAETKPVFRNQCFSLASVVLGGIALTYVFGVEGAILGSGVSSLVILVAHGTSLLEATKAGRHETSSLATDRQPYLASSLRKAG